MHIGVIARALSHLVRFLRLQKAFWTRGDGRHRPTGRIPQWTTRRSAEEVFLWATIQYAAGQV
jgi:hypothetical protein